MADDTKCPGAPKPPRKIRRIFNRTWVVHQRALFSQFLIANGVSPEVLSNVVYAFLVETPIRICVKYGVATTLEPREGFFGYTPGRIATLQQELKSKDSRIVRILAVIPEDVAKGVIKTQLEGHILKKTKGHKVDLGNHKEFRDPESLKIFDGTVKILLDMGVCVYQN